MGVRIRTSRSTCSWRRSTPQAVILHRIRPVVVRRLNLISMSSAMMFRRREFRVELDRPPVSYAADLDQQAVHPDRRGAVRRGVRPGGLGDRAGSHSGHGVRAGVDHQVPSATAVCLAADEGRLDLDGPIPGEFGGRVAPTIRQTLQHRAGFDGHYDWQYGDDASPIPISWYAQRLYRELGTGFEYANLGYRALGSLLGDLDEQLRTGVAEPLGLSSLRVGPEYSGAGPTAVRYTVDGRAYPVCRSGHPAAGDAWATATDVALFAQSSAALLKPDHRGSRAIRRAPSSSPGTPAP